MTLRFLVDEDLPRSTANTLREAGYEAEDVRDLGLGGHTDQEVFERAQSMAAAVLTGDTMLPTSSCFHQAPTTISS